MRSCCIMNELSLLMKAIILMFCSNSAIITVFHEIKVPVYLQFLNFVSNFPIKPLNSLTALFHF